MTNNIKIIQDIKRLLDQNFVFDPEFKLEIKQKMADLSVEQLERLLDVLRETDDWEREILSKKIREDKNFYKQILAEKKKFDEEVMAIYQKKMAEHDKNKINALLTRLKSF